MLAPTRVDMLIKAKHYRPNPEFKDTDHCVELDFQDNEAIKQFRNLLARALNCMDPTTDTRLGGTTRQTG